MDVLIPSVCMLLAAVLCALGHSMLGVPHCCAFSKFTPTLTGLSGLSAWDASHERVTNTQQMARVAPLCSHRLT
jgi:hypothetical protein